MARGRHKASVEQVVEQYLCHLSDKRCAEATLRWRRYHLGRFSSSVVTGQSAAGLA